MDGDITCDGASNSEIVPQIHRKGISLTTIVKGVRMIVNNLLLNVVQIYQIIRRKIMKKKLLSLLISVSLLATTMTGCGGKETTDDGDKRIESVETNAEDTTTEPTPEPSVTGDGIIMEGPSDDGIIEVEGEVTENTDGEVIESTEGDVTEVTGEATSDVIPDDGIDWSVKYDDYFSRENIMPDSPRVTITTIGENVTIPFGVVAVAGEDAYMSYDFGTAAIDMYVFADKVYAYTRMEDQEIWYCAPVISEDEAADFADLADTTLVEEENMGDCTYREAIIEDDIIYDVLDVAVVGKDVASGTATYFVNRETQLIEKCVMESEGTTVVCLVEDIESIELPVEAGAATEVTMEDIMGALLGVMLIGSGAGVD